MTIIMMYILLVIKKMWRFFFNDDGERGKTEDKTGQEEDRPLWSDDSLECSSSIEVAPWMPRFVLLLHSLPLFVLLLLLSLFHKVIVHSKHSGTAKQNGQLVDDSISFDGYLVGGLSAVFTWRRLQISTECIPSHFWPNGLNSQHRILWI